LFGSFGVRHFNLLAYEHKSLNTKAERRMNILNRQTINIATAWLLCFAASHVCLGKPAAGAASHMQKGIELAEQKNYDGAVEEFTKAIQANPKDARGYTNRGTAYRQAAQIAAANGDSAGAATRYASALTDFSKAIEVAPKDEVAYRERGMTAVMQNQFDAALADFNKAIELKPDDAYSYKFRGFAEVGLNQWDKAVADFTVAIQKQPDDPQNYDRRAWANRNLKNYDAAIADYTLLIDKNPNDAEHLVKRGATYTSLQQYEKAIADYQAALKLKADDYDTQQRLQYVQGMLAAKNAPPPPSATPTPTPSPGLITPLNVSMAVVALIIIAIIARLVTRGKADETSGRIR
jgi:tetratricopeptide (TPR) repeat protein